MKNTLRILFFSFSVLALAVSALGQTVCPYQVGYMSSYPGCTNDWGFYVLSLAPIPTGNISLSFPSNSNPGCNEAFNSSILEEGYCTSSGTYYSFDNNPPVCSAFLGGVGTLTFPDGTVCKYNEDGISIPVAECLDFVEDCKEPLKDFAKDFIPDPPNCKLWEGPCATGSEIWRTGNVIIGADIAPSSGAPQGGYKLSVKGGIITEMLQICKAEWCDYVFSDTFHNIPLVEIKDYLLKKGHLPGCTPATVIEQQGGFLLDEETVHQQEKIEEIFLHLINAQHRLDELDSKLPDFTCPEKSPVEFKGREYDVRRDIAINDLLQIECFQIKSAPGGVGGIIVSPESGPYNVSWSGAGNGHLLNVTCNGALRVNNLSAGNYIVTVTNAAGFLGTCNFTISSGGGDPINCEIFSDPFCKQAIIEMLEEEAFSTPPDCKQWEGDPCSNEGEIYRLGNVEIGTSVGRTGFSLAVKGGIVTDKLRVELCERGVGWCDYVFDKGYPLQTLLEVESFIKKNKHLPGSVTQNEVTENGGFEMRSVKLDHQKKIEEAYLHLIALDKKKQELQLRIGILAEQN
ncbi:MAG: hypothetical protein KA138_03190 [Saprospiraceae bacterium]|nr:hypothetical protein [Saprospiraceae bacterium]